MAEGPKLSLGTKAAWGGGQLAEGVKNSVFNTFMLFYYNQILGVSGTLTTLALGIALLSDAFTDPMVGSISDRFHSRWGRRHPFMFAAVVPLAMMLFLILNPPGGMSEIFYTVWLLVCAILLRLFLTLYHIPHLALGAEMSKDYFERSSVYGMGMFFGYIGGYGFAFLGYRIFLPTMEDGTNGMYNADGYTGLALFGSVVILLAISWCIAGTRHVIPRLSQVDRPDGAKAPSLYGTPEYQAEALSLRQVFDETWATIRSVKAFFPSPLGLVRDVRGAFESPSYRTIFIGIICSTIVLTIEGVFTPYMGVHFWELSTEQISLIPIAVMVALPLGAFLAPHVNRLLDKKLSLIVPSVIAITVGNVLIILRLTGFFPENGHPIILPLILLASFIGGMLGPIIFTTLNSMFADIADELDLKTGRRQEGIIFSARAFAVKLAASLGLMIGGVALDLIGFPRRSPPGTVDPDIIFRLGLFQGPATSIFTLAALLLYMRYRLDRTRHAEILKALAARSETVPSGKAPQASGDD